MYSHIPRLTQRIHEAFAASSATMKAGHGTRPVRAEPIHGSGATPPVPAPIKTFEDDWVGAGRMAKTGGTGPSYRTTSTQTPIGPHVVPDELERLVGEEIDRMMVDVSAQRFAGARQIREQRISRAYEDGQSIQQPTLSPEERQLFEARHQQQTSANGAVPQEQGFWQGRVEDFEQLKEGTLNVFAAVPGGGADLFATSAIGAGHLYQTRTNQAIIRVVEHLQRFDELNDEQRQALSNDIKMLWLLRRTEESGLARWTYRRLEEGSLSPADVPVEDLLAGTDDHTFLINLMQQTNELREAVHERFPLRSGFSDDDLTTEIGRGLGAVSVFLATQALPGSQVRFLAGNAVGVLESQGAMVERAMADGASRDQVAVAAAMATIPGLTEMLPLEYLIRMPALRNGLLRSLAEAGRQGLLEGGQEALQTVMHNAIVRMVYDEDQDLLEGAVESSEAGAGVGLTLGMMQQFAGGLIGACIREPRTVTLGGEQVTIEPEFLDGITEYGDYVHHNGTTTAVGDDVKTVRNFERASDLGWGHNVIVHGALDYDELGGSVVINGHFRDVGHVAEAIRNNPDYTEGSPICFASCWSASNNTAQQLANALQVQVYAPTRIVAWDPIRDRWVLDVEMDDYGPLKHPEIEPGWRTFYPESSENE